MYSDMACIYYMNKIKICTKCNKRKKIKNFYRSKKGDGFESICIQCRRKRFNEIRFLNKKRNNIIIFIKEKKCSVCKNIKNINMFYKDSARTDGLSYVCKSCSKIAVKKHELKNKLNHVIPTTKICKKCNKRKKNSFFSKNSNRKDGLHSICKKCSKQYRIINNKQLKEYRSKRKSIRAFNTKSRRKNDQYFNLSERIKSSFNYSFNIKNIKKQKSFLKYTGFRISEYISYLQHDPLFHKYKNNKNLYHIDHIIPISIYDFSNNNDIKKCWNPENLRIIDSKKNMKKHSKINIKLIEKYKIKHLLPDNFKL